MNTQSTNPEITGAQEDSRTASRTSTALQMIGFLSVLVFLIDYTLEVLKFNHLYESRHILLVLLQLAFSLWAMVELFMIRPRQGGIPLKPLGIAISLQGLAGGSRLLVENALNVSAPDWLAALANIQFGLASLYVPLHLLNFLLIFSLLTKAFSHEERQRSRWLQAEMSRRQQAEAMLRSAQQEILRQEIERTQTEERQRILQDLHDGFGSQLATARQRLSKGSVPQIEITNLLTECMSDLHLIVDTLENPESELGSALRALRNRLQHRLMGASLQISWEISLDETPPLAPRNVIQVLRILQEAINNTLKHARAEHLLITAHYERSGHVAITLHDDGVGLPETLHLGHGINNMQRRARELGGAITFDRAVQGTTIGLRFPVAQLQPT